MGRVKTIQGKEVEADLKGILKAQQMAEAFANHRTRDFLKAFLLDTGLAEHMYAEHLREVKDTDHTIETYTKVLIDDFTHSMGKGLALAYACGYCDAVQKKTIKQLYVPGNLVAAPNDRPDTEETPSIGGEGEQE